MERVAVYGAGVYGGIFGTEIERNSIKVECFIDQFSTKKEIIGKHIYKLENIELDNLTVYISITSPKVELIVIDNLKKLGIETIYTFVDTLKKFPNLIPQCVKQTKTWFSEDKSIMIDQKKLEEVNSLLSDNKSKDLLHKIEIFRKTLSSESYLIPDLDPQYFPSDIALFDHLDKVRFIDGGAYIGDTLFESISEFHKNGKEIEYIASFEPDTENLIKLSNEVLKQQKRSKCNFIIFPCGLWSSNKVLQFSANNEASSSIVNDSASENIIKIMGATIDTTLMGSRPNYIKMDIEGAEKEAIIGAKNTISTYSPVLAISLYHKPQDLWELPLLINSMNSNYNMFLRIYGHMGLEIVLYCVPKNYV